MHVLSVDNVKIVTSSVLTQSLWPLQTLNPKYLDYDRRFKFWI